MPPRSSDSFIRFLGEELLQPEHERWWDALKDKRVEDIKRKAESLNITVPPEYVLTFYATLVQNDIVYSRNLVQLFRITGVPLPADLAQQAYRKILLSSPSGFFKTRDGYQYSYDPADGCDMVFEASGVRPRLPEDVVQKFYLARIGLRNGDNEVRRVAGMTDIEPVFDPEEINGMYKQWIFSGKLDSAKYAVENTGVPLRLDGETKDFALQKIMAGVEKARSSGDYVRRDIGDAVEFETFRLEEDLHTTKELVSTTGIVPDQLWLQSVYESILAEDPHWVVRIEQIQKATDIVPAFTEEALGDAAWRFAGQGNVNALYNLQRLNGRSSWSPELVEKVYDAILADVFNSGSEETRPSYRRDWLDRMCAARRESGEDPSTAQMAEVFCHLLQDRHFGYGDGFQPRQATEFLKKNFSSYENETAAQGIFHRLFESGDFTAMAEFARDVEEMPIIPEDLVRKTCDRLCDDDVSKRGKTDRMEEVRTLLGLATLPVTPAVAQRTYGTLVERRLFANVGDSSLQLFYRLMELTGIKPELTSEQLSKAYRAILRPMTLSKADEFQGVVGVPPTPDDLQDVLFQGYIGPVMWIEERIDSFMDKYGIALAAATARRAVLHLWENTKIKDVRDFMDKTRLIEVRANMSMPVDYVIVASQIERMLREQNALSGSSSTIGFLFDWLQRVSGKKPAQGLVDLAYEKTLDAAMTLSAGYVGPSRSTWDKLLATYGPPSPEAVQRMCAHELASID